MSGPLDPSLLFGRVPLDEYAVEHGMTRATTRAIAEVFGCSDTTIERALIKGWDVWQAESWAMRYGLMPYQVWPEWVELCDEACGVRAEP